MAAQDIGTLGPFEGPAVTIQCPLRDSLPSVYLWIVLFALLMRKPNRTIHAWTILLPLLAIYLILHVAESKLNSYLIFHLNMYICSQICELLRFLALGLAVLLTVSDLIKVQSRLFRFILVFLILFCAGIAGILLNTPMILTAGALTILFGLFLLIFMVGLSVIHGVLRRLFGRHQLPWCVGVCLVFGLLPILILGSIELILSRSVQLQSTQELLRVLIVLSQAISAPYFVFSWFVLAALLSPFYRRRFEHCFTHDLSRILA